MTEPRKIEPRDQALDLGSFVNNIGRTIFNAISVGKGLSKKQAGNQVIIELNGQQNTGGSGVWAEWTEPPT